MTKKLILITDDEEYFCKLLKWNIEADPDYECLIATTGTKGIELVKKDKPDLVLLDIRMPGVDGMETLKKIKRLNPQTPVAMVTAVWDPQEAKRCLEAGAYEYITKPVDFEHLKTVLLIKLFGNSK